MYLVVGLGNPGKQYEATRHNMGFDTIDVLVERHKIPIVYRAFSVFQFLLIPDRRQRT